MSDTDIIIDNIIIDNVSEIIPSLIVNPKIKEINNNHIKINYVFYFGYVAMKVICEINKFSSIEESVANYNNIQQQYSDNNKKIRLGDEGFAIEKNEKNNDEKNSIVVFRKANVVVKSELDGQYSTLDQIINYAEKIDKNLIRFAKLKTIH